MKNIITIKFIGDDKFSNGLLELEKQLNFRLGEGLIVEAIKCDDKVINIKSNADKSTFTYYDSNSFFRGFSLSLQYIGQDKDITSIPNFQDLGTMQNCSRTVLNVATVKKIIRQSAIMGYNYLELYTEDTYEIPSRPYFGHLRGKYSQKELIEIVEYGEMFGVEIVPCIQTLAHLAHLFKWPEFLDLLDINDTLLVNNEQTYLLIEDMIKSIRYCFKTKRINVGMDEGYSMGFGRYNWFIGDINNRSMLFINHLKKVVDICKKYDFEPEIWFDMLFGMNFKGYIDPPKEFFINFSDEITKNFPDINLIYWNYNVLSVEDCSRLIGYTSQLSSKIKFASMAHGYFSYAPRNNISEKQTQLVVDVCGKNNITDLMITWWGGFTSPFSVLPALFSFAEKAYITNDIDLEKRCEFLFGYSYSDFCKLDIADEFDDNENSHNGAMYLLANDILLGILDKHIPKNILETINKNYDILKKLANKNSDFSYIFNFESELLKVLKIKSLISVDIKRYYDEKNMEKLKEICNSVLPNLSESVKSFKVECYNIWHKDFKTFGWERMDMRLGGLIAGIDTAIHELNDFIKGKSDKIEVLEEDRLPFVKSQVGHTIFSPTWEDCCTMSTNKM